MKRLLQNLQPVKLPTAAVSSTEDAHSHSSNEEPTFSNNTPHSPQLDAMSTCASNIHFQDNLPTEVSELLDKKVGSTVSGGSPVVLYPRRLTYWKCFGWQWPILVLINALHILFSQVCFSAGLHLWIPMLCLHVRSS